MWCVLSWLCITLYTCWVCSGFVMDSQHIYIVESGNLVLQGKLNPVDLWGWMCSENIAGVMIYCVPFNLLKKTWNFSSLSESAISWIRRLSNHWLNLPQMCIKSATTHNAKNNAWCMTQKKKLLAQVRSRQVNINVNFSDNVDQKKIHIYHWSSSSPPQCCSNESKGPRVV